jgi:uncharacterized ParB-like nuclease family protein
MDFEIRYPSLQEFDSEALRSLLPYVTGPCSHRMLATRSIRKNSSDAGQQRSRAFAQEVAALTDRIQASGRMDAILVTKRVDGVYVCLDGHHRLQVYKRLKLKTIPVVILHHNLKRN